MNKIAGSTASVWLAGVTLAAVFLAGCDKSPDVAAPLAERGKGPVLEAPAAKREQVQLVHVHGLTYSPDGAEILIPSHHGLAVFDGSSWSKAPGPQHDYMGFSATKDALFSSGHPAPNTGLINPFGVIKSTDGGQTWQTLGFEGESDFHLLTTGYETNAIYVVNFQPNSKMKEAGIYYTVNEGFSWQRAQLGGLQGNPATLAAHPSKPKVLAVGTDAGLFLSQDAGDTFEKIAAGEVVAVFFDLNGKQLWFSTADERPGLSRFDLDSKETSSVDLPPMQNDAVAYVAQNPVARDEYAIATFQRSVYLSQDAGKSWKQIAEKGETR